MSDINGYTGYFTSKSLMAATKTTFGSILNGVISNLLSILILGTIIGGVIAVARWIAGPAEYVMVKEKDKTAKT